MKLLTLPVLAVIVILAGLLFGLVWLIRRRKTAAPPERAPGSRWRRWGLYGLRLIAFGAAALVILGGTVMLVVADQQVREELAPAPSTVAVPDDLPFAVQAVRFTGGDEITLAGWYVPPAAAPGPAVILLHGYGGNRLGARWYAERLVAAGYGVLLYDERASGESDGTRRSYGWEDVPDVGGALVFIQAQPEIDPTRLGIAGCSIGGQIALRAAAAYPALRAVWADGPSGVTSADLPPVDSWALLLAHLSNRIVDRMYVDRLGIPAPPAMIESIGQIAPRPVQLVAGGRPREMFGSEARRTTLYAEHAGAGTDLWIIPEATHCDGPARRPDEYAQRLVAFFDAALR